MGPPGLSPTFVTAARGCAGYLCRGWAAVPPVISLSLHQGIAGRGCCKAMSCGDSPTQRACFLQDGLGAWRLVHVHILGNLLEKSLRERNC